jgi:catechol 2,3-dioxygenase-like lactoylglutathione lyase family enzyme
MPMFPTLSVTDIGASASWYTERVGFARVFAIPGTGGDVGLERLRWSKYADLLLVPEASAPYPAQAKGTGITLSFLAQAEAIDNMAAKLEANGVEIAEGPPSTGHGTRGTSSS